MSHLTKNFLMLLEIPKRYELFWYDNEVLDKSSSLSKIVNTGKKMVLWFLVLEDCWIFCDERKNERQNGFKTFDENGFGD